MVRTITRRFDVWDEHGRLYVLIEFAYESGGRRVKTLTDLEAIPTSTAGEYLIPAAGIVVNETRPPTPPGSTNS